MTQLLASSATIRLAHPIRRVYRHHGQAITIDAPPSNSSIWIPPINKTVATEGTGIAQLSESIAKHAEHLRVSGDWNSRDRTRLGSELEAAIQQELMSQFRKNIPNAKFEETVGQMMNRNLSPQEAAKILLNGRVA